MAAPVTDAAKPIDLVRAMLRDLLGGPDASIAHRRQQSELFSRQQQPLPEGIRVEARRLGGVGVEWIEAADPCGGPVFLHLHGGGYVMGDPAGSRGFTLALAQATGGPVVSVEYRLAPAHRFPAAVDDGILAYRALIESGVPAQRVAIGGESAGGGLAVAVLLAARGAGLPMPACLVALSPWANLKCEGAAYEDLHGRDPLLTRQALLEMAGEYLGAADPRLGLASPALADLRGLPPMLIQVGAEEVLLDDAHALAAQARLGGVEVELEVWPEMIHVFQMFGQALPQAGQAVAEIGGLCCATRWA